MNFGIFLFLSIILVLNLLATKTEGKIYERCELARELFEEHEIPQREAAMFACIADAHSRLNTSAITRYSNSPGAPLFHGLFQFGDDYWCSVKNEKKLCGSKCNKYRDDDITDDVDCAWNYVYEQHKRISGNGFDGWDAKNVCEKRIKKYLKCFDETSEENINTNSRSAVASSKRATTTIKPVKSQKIKSTGKIYSRCELAKELYEEYYLDWDFVPIFVCLADRESNYKTFETKVSTYDDSTTYGIFQISDKRYCSSGSPGKICNLECDSLRDENIEDDVNCMLKIFANLKKLGTQNWESLEKCTRNDVWSYVEGCFSYDDETATEAPLTTTSTTTTRRPVTTRTTTTRTTTTRTTTPKFVPIEIKSDIIESSAELPLSNDIPVPSLILLPPFENEEDSTEILTSRSTLRTSSTPRSTTTRSTTTRSTTLRPITTRRSSRTTTRKISEGDSTSLRPTIFNFIEIFPQFAGALTTRPSRITPKVNPITTTTTRPIITTTEPIPTLILTLVPPDISYDEDQLVTASSIQVSKQISATDDFESPSVTAKLFKISDVQRFTRAIPTKRFNRF
uniref:lysozyme n=1 Tax=Culicoides sonorensis TaxID=179676 RepID=A0A336L9G4_CULSO